MIGSLNYSSKTNSRTNKRFKKQNFSSFKILNLFFIFLLSIIFFGGCGGGKSSPPCIVRGSSSSITKPPSCLKLSPFYTKYLNSGGIPIAGSDHVSDIALFKVKETLEFMLRGLTKVREKMLGKYVRISIAGEGESINDILRAESVSTRTHKPVTLIGNRRVVTVVLQDNILCSQSDKWASEDVLVHELAHAIHEGGIKYADPNFEQKLKQAYDNRGSKWSYTYADSQAEEYLAEGVQSFYGVNGSGVGFGIIQNGILVANRDGIHNHVDTPQELQTHDPSLYQLIEDYFPPFGSNNPSCHA